MLNDLAAVSNTGINEFTKRGVGIKHHGDAFDARRDLSEQFKHLACY
jgi:hypothetical protein